MNADDPIQYEKLKTYVKKYGFSQDQHQFYKIEFLGASPFVKIRFENEIVVTQLVGSYNFTNCCAAILMGKYFNVVTDNIRHALENYVPANNRSQILEKNGYRIILDAYNANPTSMAAALENFKDIDGAYKIAILGDMFELGESAKEEHGHIAELASKMPLDQVILVGENFYDTNFPAQKFSSFDNFSNYLKTSKLPKSTILIKGSRGMALERLTEIL